MNQSAVTTTPVSDGVRQALEISLRGVQELLPQDEWVKKLARSEATGQPLGSTTGILRVVAHFVDSIICYVGWLFPLWDAKRQTLADKIIKSVVVADPNAGQTPMQ